MKYIKTFESFKQLPIPISINDFLKDINIQNIDKISDWWEENLNFVNIYYFSFNTHKPIMGGLVEEKGVAINKNFNAPPFIKLFLLIHESKHILQKFEVDFNDLYFNSVLNNNKQEFLDFYEKVEKEANDFAINIMKSFGFEDEMKRMNFTLRSNERVGFEIFNMMKNDIEKYKPKDIYDLIKKQIL